MGTKKPDELQQAVLKAKYNLNEELDEFIQKIDNAADYPNNFITMTLFEDERGKLYLKNTKSDSLQNQVEN